jgi:carboxypeptidase Q
VGTDPELRRRLNGQTIEQYLAARRKTAELKEKALKMMVEEGVLAIITPSRDGGDGGGTGIIFDDNGANVSRDAQKPEKAVKIPIDWRG